MTQKNIEIMDIIVTEMANGAKLSQTLGKMYKKRNIAIPFYDNILDLPTTSLKVSPRAINALMRGRLYTLRDIVEYACEKKITTVKTFGNLMAVETFEAILDYCWDNLSEDKRVDFLIDVVERNEEYLKWDI